MTQDDRKHAPTIRVVSRPVPAQWPTDERIAELTRARDEAIAAHAGAEAKYDLCRRRELALCEGLRSRRESERNAIKAAERAEATIDERDATITELRRQLDANTNRQTTALSAANAARIAAEAEVERLRGVAHELRLAGEPLAEVVYAQGDPANRLLLDVWQRWEDEYDALDQLREARATQPETCCERQDNGHHAVDCPGWSEPIVYRDGTTEHWNAREIRLQARATQNQEERDDR